MPASLSYEMLPDLPPFRRIAGGGVSRGNAALIGLDAPSAGNDEAAVSVAEVRSDLCTALFGRAPGDGRLPIAYFSDFRCPYCRALEKDLDAILSERGSEIRLVQHELPIFGPPSELAARASVAAAMRGRQRDLRARLMRSALVTDARYIETIAGGLGIDVARLRRDMASDTVAQSLARTRILADVLGFVGTPGLVIGRTVINGAVSRAVLNRVIDDELSLPPLPCAAP